MLLRTLFAPICTKYVYIVLLHVLYLFVRLLCSTALRTRPLSSCNHKSFPESLLLQLSPHGFFVLLMIVLLMLCLQFWCLPLNCFVW